MAEALLRRPELEAEDVLVGLMLEDVIATRADRWPDLRAFGSCTGARSDLIWNVPGMTDNWPSVPASCRPDVSMEGLPGDSR